MADREQPEHHRNSDKLVTNVDGNIEKAIRRGNVRAVRKRQRRNLEPKPPRKKDWTLERHEDWDDLDYERRERIMPLDEGDRRRAIDQAAFKDSAAPSGPDTRKAPAVDSRHGMVVSVSSGLCTVDLGEATILCRVRTRLTTTETPFTNVVAVGDQVAVSDDGAGGGIIEEVRPRRSVLARPDVHDNNRSRRSQVIVANADQLLIVSSWREPPFWPELVDRCIIAAQRSSLIPVVCVNKIDLAEGASEIEEAFEPYQVLGYRIVRTSVVTGEGVGELGDVLRDKTTALTGMSGTGKSSLISAVQPGLDLRTSDVSDSSKHSGEGRHTTTQVTMHGFEVGGFVVDTPGIREFGLSGLRRQELADFFPEIAALAPGCQFNNCAHLEEPECAVTAGITSGAIPATRYHSYRSILPTLPG